MQCNHQKYMHTYYIVIYKMEMQGTDEIRVLQYYNIILSRV